MNRQILLLVFFLPIFLHPGKSLWAQTDAVTQQLWGDFTYFYPFATIYRARAEVGRRNLMSDGADWNRTVIKPSIEVYPIPAIDVMSAFGIFITNESVGPNQLELRPDIGFRLNIFQQRLILRTNTRLEYRNIYYNDTTETSRTGRFRSRVELIFPFNNPSVRDPKTLYGLTDYELFVDLSGKPPGERFADRSRFRAGLGWRFNLEWRVELLYTLQKSRDTSSADFQTSDNIYRIRVKFQPLRSKTEHLPDTQPYN